MFVRRYLVPVCSNREDIAYTILEKLGANEQILKQSHQLYNLEVENKHSIFFNKSLFDKHFYTDQDCFVDIVLSDEEDAADEDTFLKEEEKEESPAGYLDINVERVRQISEELEIIENKLNIVKEQKSIVQKKVEYCRTCCSYEHGEVSSEEIHTMSIPLITGTPSRVDKDTLEKVLTPTKDIPLIFHTPTVRTSLPNYDDSTTISSGTITSITEAATWQPHGICYLKYNFY